MDGNLALDEYGGIQDMGYALPEHSAIITNFVAQVEPQLKGSRCILLHEHPFHWEEDERHENRFPDAAILCDDKRRKGVSFTGVPRFVMEVLSPSTESMDRHEKMDLYGKVGVMEYWLVSWEKRTIERYMIDDAGTRLMPYDVVTSENVPSDFHLFSLNVIKLDFDTLMDVSRYQM